MSELEMIQDLKLVPSSDDTFGHRRAITFDKLIQEHRALTTAIKEMENDKKKLGDKIMNWLADTDTKTVMSQGHRVTLVQGSHSTLDKQKLVEAGVLPSVIVACTKTTDYVFVKITEGK